MSGLCTLCPRNCKTDRSVKSTGFCGVPADIYAARASLHMWEEPCLSGINGSGTVFFSGCNLKCVYCQNHDIALGGVKGKRLSVTELAEVFIRLQNAGAHNINLVTPSHYVPQIREALLIARDAGLTLPIVYNSSGYDLPDTLRLLDGLIDIYMPDFKYLSPELAARYSRAADYPQVAKAALAEMFRQVGKPVFAQTSPAAENDGRVIEPLLTRGVLVRYLLLPGALKDGKAILDYLHTAYGSDIILSIMNQYTPQPAQLTGYPELNRRVTAYEYNALVDYAISLGIENAYIQEGKTAEESFIPDFEDRGFLIFS